MDDELDRIRKYMQQSPVSVSETLPTIPLTKKALAFFVDRLQKRRSSYTVLTDPKLVTHKYEESFSPAFLFTYGVNEEPGRKWEAVVVKDWDRSVSVTVVWKIKDKLQLFPLLGSVTLVGGQFSLSARSNAENTSIKLLTEGEIGSRAYKHFPTEEKINEIVNDPNVQPFDEVFK